jgi:hypothetical protein
MALSCSKDLATPCCCTGSQQQPGAEPAMQTDTINVEVPRTEALWGEPDS